FRRAAAGHVHAVALLPQDRRIGGGLRRGLRVARLRNGRLREEVARVDHPAERVLRDAEIALLEEPAEMGMESFARGRVRAPDELGDRGMAVHQNERFELARAQRRARHVERPLTRCGEDDDVTRVQGYWLHKAPLYGSRRRGAQEVFARVSTQSRIKGLVGGLAPKCTIPSSSPRRTLRFLRAYTRD